MHYFKNKKREIIGQMLCGLYNIKRFYTTCSSPLGRLLVPTLNTRLFWLRETFANVVISLQNDGKEVKLTETDGIDILGNIVESNDLSHNKTLYGSLHNAGHDLIGYIHDPEYKFMVIMTNFS